MDTDTDSIQESGPGLMGDSIMEEEEEEEASQEQLTPSSQASLRRGARVTSSTKEATSSSITKEVAKEARVTPTLHQIPLVPDGPVGFASLPDQVYRRSLRKGEVGAYWSQIRVIISIHLLVNKSSWHHYQFPLPQLSIVSKLMMICL